MNISSVYQAVQQFPARNTESSPPRDSAAPNPINTPGQVSPAEETSASSAAQGAQSVAASEQGQNLSELATTLVNASGRPLEPGAIIDLFI